ncbi:hypothetical protein B9Z55_012746 [Caenorhabditis nigoni]|uniref:Uncharacterized protein n=1 Tax=Caenorhabditis nigoni TaxID=1611254 RepID=A0A2G5TYP6_9PELO|nr:hypothetical protein B9Z55_012746 [Caenorhabditis nigoni]
MTCSTTSGIVAWLVLAQCEMTGYKMYCSKMTFPKITDSHIPQIYFHMKMLFLALSVVVPIIPLITICSSKTPTKITNTPVKLENSEKSTKKPVKKEKKPTDLIEITATQKTEKIDPLKSAAPEDHKTKIDKKKEEFTLDKTAEMVSLHGKEGKKPAKPDPKKSSYAGINEKSQLKPPPPKLQSVITIPTIRTEVKATVTCPESAKNKKQGGEINDKSDDTIDDIPSVRTKEGVSYEGDGPPIKSPDQGKMDEKAVKKNSKEKPGEEKKLP